MVFNIALHQMYGKNNPNKVLEYKKALKAAFLDDDIPNALSEQIFKQAYDGADGVYINLEENYEELATLVNSAFAYGCKHVVQKF